MPSHRQSTMCLVASLLLMLRDCHGPLARVDTVLIDAALSALHEAHSAKEGL